MTFFLSQKSLNELNGVNEKLVSIVKDAIKASTVDFIVGEGLRTIERQRYLISQGKSKTERSKHITGHAVDLWAYVNNNVSWDLKHYFDIAQAMRDSAIRHNTVIVWGAVWDKPLNEIKNTESEPNHYTQRRKILGKKAFIDAVHFELKG
jgi:peptidoglycan L-alanyl-D-glutamate endopeptidase CwlK